MKRLIAAALGLLLASTAEAQIVGTFPYTFTNGTTADATQVNADFSYVASQINANAATAGANSNITALLGLTTPLSASQGGSQLYTGGTSSGTANAQTLAVTVPTGFTLTAGRVVTFTAGFTNTTAMTLSVNGTTATNVYKRTPSGLVALTGGEVIAATGVMVQYNGTQFELISHSLPETGVVTTLASAATTDLGSVPSHTISVTGTTTITSLGSSANVNYPVYRVTFTGALTLTYNVTSLILPGAVNITTAAGDTAEFVYLGSGNWRLVQYMPAATAPVAYPIAAASGLAITNGATPASQAAITADEAVLVSTAGGGIRVTSVSCTMNGTTTGAGGLDTGALAASTWYHLYIISNGSTTSCLGSTSATSPSMPAGYIYKMRVGAVQTDGASAFYRFQQRGAKSRYKLTTATNTATYPFSQASSNTTGAWVAITVQGNNSCSPTTSTSVTYSLAQGTGTTHLLYMAPNASVAQSAPTALCGIQQPQTQQCDILLEATTVQYLANNTGDTFNCQGWVDKVNAN